MYRTTGLSTTETVTIVGIAATLFGGAALTTQGGRKAHYGVMSGALSTILSFGLVLARTARVEAKVTRLEADIARHDARLVGHADDVDKGMTRVDKGMTRNAQMTTALYEQTRDLAHKDDHQPNSTRIRRIY